MSVVLFGAQGLRAIAADERVTLVLNVRDSSALPGLDADAVVEIPCLVGRNGAHPIATGARDPPLVDSVHAAEQILSCDLETLPELRAVLVAE